MSEIPNSRDFSIGFLIFSGFCVVSGLAYMIHLLAPLVPILFSAIGGPYVLP